MFRNSQKTSPFKQSGFFPELQKQVQNKFRRWFGSAAARSRAGRAAMCPLAKRGRRCRRTQERFIPAALKPPWGTERNQRESTLRQRPRGWPVEPNILGWLQRRAPARAPRT